MIRLLLPFAVAIIMVPSFAASGENCRDCHGQKSLPGFIDQKAFRESVHGIFPCTACHLNVVSYPHGTDARRTLSLIEQCGNCHPDQMKTYRKTYHGKVTRLGYAAPAKCSDCHGSHNIARIADKASLLSEQNILSTCGKCHPRATIGFTKFYAHADETNREKYPILFYTYVFMTALLIGVFTFFFTHTFLWAYRSLKERMNKRGE